MARWVHSILFGLTTALLGVAVLLSGFTHERDLGLRWLFKLRGPIDPPAEVVVVGIDSTSGRDMDLPRLPRDWPRSLHAVTVARLTASEAKTIIFDMDFSRPKTEEEDKLFADAIRSSGRTVLFERLDGRNERIVGGENQSRWIWVEEASPPAEPLASAANAIAPFPLPKVDQATHQFWAFKPSADDLPTTAAVAAQMALLDYDGAWRDALATAGVDLAAFPSSDTLDRPGILREYMQRLRKLFLADPGLGDRVRAVLEDDDRPPAERLALLSLASLYGGPSAHYANFYGPPGTIRTIPYQDLGSSKDLNLAVVPEKIAPTDISQKVAGSTVFIGYSDLFSPDQPDRFYTVFTSDKGIDLSGSEIMATAFSNLLHNEAIRQPPAWISLAAIGLFGLILSQIVFWFSPYYAIPAVLAAAGGYGYIAVRVFTLDNIWIPMATPMGVQLPFAIGAGLIGQYLVERRNKQRVGDAIAQYLPKHLAEGITEGRIATGSINQVVHGVCLATDMSGFSRIAETKSPSELAEFMNAYFEIVAAALKRCEVDVTEFHADTIMCAWLGKPEETEFRRRALRAGLGVATAIEQFGAEDSDLMLRPRVGLQDGPFYLGHTGGGGRLSYSILGNPANSASRLEGLNKRLRTRVLAASGVAASLDEFVVRPLGEFQVVGKAEFVDVVEVMGTRAEPVPGRDELIAEFSDALRLFRSEQWQDALATFRRVAARFPEDGPTRFFRKLCKAYLTQGVPESNPARPQMTSK